MRHTKRFLSLCLIAVLLLAAAGGWLLLRPRPDAQTALTKAVAALRPGDAPAGNSVGDQIARAARESFSVAAGPVEQHFRRAIGSVTVRFLDLEALTTDLAPAMQPLVAAQAEAASRRSEVYDADGAYLPTVTQQAYETVMQERLTHAADYCRTTTVPVTLSYTRGGWTLENADAITACFQTPNDPAPGLTTAAAVLEPVALHYALPDWTGLAPAPDPACFGQTTDPQEIAALLATDTAQRLIDGQTLDWTVEKETLAGRPVYYYLDETILALVWQEDEHGAVGTFAEVIVADASQLRRKVADDDFESPNRYYPTELAAQANAVAAVSGDFYNSGRSTFGLCVYDGQLRRSCLYAGQTCFFTDEGDMVFAYENDFSSEAEVQRYLDDDHIMFSLAFGPVLVDHGVDVTPYDYPIGEVRDTYARCAIGQLGTRHYLAMTINCESPDHYVYVTLRQAADSMIAHGCYNAYTLDGGQTGSIIINDSLINPVQFGVEREMSDIVYFATALPEP